MINNFQNELLTIFKKNTRNGQGFKSLYFWKKCSHVIICMSPAFVWTLNVPLEHGYFGIDTEGPATQGLSPEWGPVRSMGVVWAETSIWTDSPTPVQYGLNQGMVLDVQGVNTVTSNILWRCLGRHYHALTQTGYPHHKQEWNITIGACLHFTCTSPCILKASSTHTIQSTSILICYIRLSLSPFRRHGQSPCCEINGLGDCTKLSLFLQSIRIKSQAFAKLWQHTHCMSVCIEMFALTGCALHSQTMSRRFLQVPIFKWLSK